MRKIFIDCKEQIPCDPCQHCCPVSAIHSQLDSTPTFDRDHCVGCGICVASCPGQACFLVDEEAGPGEATVDFPYEFLPRPSIGETVQACDNTGRILCSGIVEALQERPSQQQTAICRIRIPLEFAYEVRGIRPITAREIAEDTSAEATSGEPDTDMDTVTDSDTDSNTDTDPIICRCEEIRRSEILEAIDAGCRSVAAVKRYTRAGMGSCQGRTCGPVIESMLTAAGVTDVTPGKPRFPVVPCSLQALEESK